MDNLVTYIIGVATCGALFVAFYAAVLHRRTAFRIGRWFLPVSLVASAVIPALDIPVWPAAPIVAGTVSAMDLAIEPTVVSVAPIVWSKIALWALWTLWGGGVVVLAVSIARQSARVNNIRRRAEIVSTSADYTVVRSADVEAPFSFLSTIFVVPELAGNELRQVVMHESSHIRHGHSREKIVMEVLKSLFWFSPAAWWAARLLGEVHEFEADRDVLDGGSTVEEYLPLIFRQTFGCIPELTVGMGDSLTKKRFLMMKNAMKPTKFNGLRVAGVLPLAAGMMMLFSFTTRPPEVIALESATEPAAATESAQNPQQTPAQSSDIPMFMVDVMPTFNGGDLLAFRDWVQAQLKYPKEAFDNRIQGTETVKFVIERDGSLSDIESANSVHPLLYAEAERVLSRSPKWTPGMNKGKPVRVSYILPLMFKIEDERPAQNPAPSTSEGATALNLRPLFESTSVAAPSADTLVFLDGREISYDLIKAMDTNKIASITVLKDESATALYGTRAKSGVILITSKK
jgi:TonB-dependent SusC/RagA subfamily outer membrane receptor